MHVSKSVSPSLMSDFCDPVYCSPPGSSVNGILLARILEWVAVPFSRRIFPTQGLYPGLPYCRQILYCMSHQSHHDLNKHTTGSLTPDTLRRGQKKCSHPCQDLTACNPLLGQPGKAQCLSESYPRGRGLGAGGRTAETNANCPQQPLHPNPRH